MDHNGVTSCGIAENITNSCTYIHERYVTDCAKLGLYATGPTPTENCLLETYIHMKTFIAVPDINTVWGSMYCTYISYVHPDSFCWLENRLEAKVSAQHFQCRHVGTPTQADLFSFLAGDIRTPANICHGNLGTPHHFFSIWASLSVAFQGQSHWC